MTMHLGRLALAACLALAAFAPSAAALTDCGEPGVACGGDIWESMTAKPTALIRVPLVRQGRDNTCGVACVQSILRYAGYEFDLREELYIPALGTDDSGTSIRRMTDFLNRVRRHPGGRVMQASWRENMTIAEVIRNIDAGSPVILLLQAWQEDNDGRYTLNRDYSRTVASGHYVIAVGYDAERVYFMDPSIMGAYAYIPRGELDARWHGAGDITPEGVEYVEHGGIVVTIDDPRYSPDEFFKML